MLYFKWNFSRVEMYPPHSKLPKGNASTPTDPVQMAKVAMNEASTTAKPVVEAQA